MMTIFARVNSAIAGFSYSIFWWGYFIFLPFDQVMTDYPAVINHPLWVPLNCFQVFGIVSYILFFIDFSRGSYQENASGRLFMVLQVIGFVTLSGIAFFETFLWPIIAINSPSLLILKTSPIYASSIFLTPVIIGLFAYLVSNIYLGIKLGRVNRILSFIYIAGVVGFSLGPVTGPLRYVVQSIGITGLALSLVSFAFIKSKKRIP